MIVPTKGLVFVPNRRANTSFDFGGEFVPSPCLRRLIRTDYLKLLSGLSWCPFQPAMQASSHLSLPGLVCIGLSCLYLHKCESCRYVSQVFSGRGFLALSFKNSPSTSLDSYTSVPLSPALDIVVVPHEKATMAVEGTDSPKPSTLDTPNMNNASDCGSAQLGTPVQGMTDNQYGHGLKLVLLVGASIVSASGIALDQVSTLPTHAVIAKNTSDTKDV